MARTQAADYERRREAIVEKAAALFATSGFMGASVADLAKACKTSKSLIYHYYPSKEDVLYEVMTSHVDELVRDVEAVQALDGNAVDRLRALLKRFMSHYVGAASRQKVLLNELGNLPKDKRKIIVAKQRIVIDAVQGLLIAVRTDLASDAGRARVETMLLFGMINWTHTWFDPKGAVSVDEVAELALQRITAIAHA